MSEENLAVIRQFFDAYNRGNLQATLDAISPEFEFRPSGVFMDTERVYRGRAGWEDFWDTFTAAWKSIAVNVERIEDLGERALVLGVFHGRGHGSGVEVTRESAWLLTFRDGLIAQSQAFGNWDDALAAAGLSE